MAAAESTPEIGRKLEELVKARRECLDLYKQCFERMHIQWIPVVHKICNDKTRIALFDYNKI